MLRPTSVGTHLCQLPEEEEVNYNESTDELTLDESDGKEVTLMVTVPGIPLDWPAQKVVDWMNFLLGHPVDSAYEAMVRVRAISEHPHGGENPEREENGCMIHGKGQNK
jgi:hypothetical protein